MEYIELYNEDLLDIISIGKSTHNFNPKLGDYIKVEILTDDDALVGILYSNRLLLKEPLGDNFYLGPYHYHQENPEMGFCTGREHTKDSICNLEPISTSTIGEGSENKKFKKQVVVFLDDKKRLYIKPNDLIKLFNVPKGKYKLRIHFLRNIKSPMGNFLDMQKFNLIENGNFFAGLEASQAGDLDRSNGKNNFRKIGNPGFSPYALEQSGLPNNDYNIKVTGIKPNKNYVFSCWVAWDENYNGDNHIVSFDTVSSQNTSNPKLGIIDIIDTDARGSFINNDPDTRILATKQTGGVNWYRLYSFVSTDDNADLGYIHLHIGKNVGGFNASMNPLGKRYFTDLRLVEVQSLFNENIKRYINSLKNEIDMSAVLNYYNIKSLPGDEIQVTQDLSDYSADPIPAAVTNLVDTIDGVTQNPNLVDNAIFEDNTHSLESGGKIIRRSIASGKRIINKRRNKKTEEN